MQVLLYALQMPGLSGVGNPIPGSLQGQKGENILLPGPGGTLLEGGLSIQASH